MKWKPGHAAVGLARPAVRFALRHWIRHEEMIRLRQQVRYLALAELLGRTKTDYGDLTPYELSVFSQNGEDGVLSEIFERIGAGRRRFVEIGASVNEANCLFLADARGWNGCFVEADADEHERLSAKYRASERVRVIRSFVTPKNAAQILREAGVDPGFDLLSLDIDGNDLWIWKALAELKPRVVVLEYNASLPAGSTLVQPYDQSTSWDHSTFYGASLGAALHLAHIHKYRLVHLELSGNNAFFVSDVEEGQFLPEAEVVSRAPNYFLYGLGHEEDKRSREFVDVGESDELAVKPAERTATKRPQ